jgi:hypothetical protein
MYLGRYQCSKRRSAGTAILLTGQPLFRLGLFGD